MVEILRQKRSRSNKSVRPDIKISSNIWFLFCKKHNKDDRNKIIDDLILNYMIEEDKVDKDLHKNFYIDI